jgi:hypothetical protein
MDLKQASYQASREYPEALTWLVNSEYNVKTTLDEKSKTVKIDLLHNEVVIKSELVKNTIQLPEHIQNKIIILFKHFKK